MWRERIWVATSSEEAVKEDLRFRVFSFNTLANSLVTVDRYNSASPEVLSWCHRGPALLREILSHDADVIALQEVDVVDYPYFRCNLLHFGYDGVYKAKSAGKFDGLATFWKINRFRLLRSSSKTLLACMPLERGQVLLAVVLEDVMSTSNLSAKSDDYESANSEFASYRSAVSPDNYTQPSDELKRSEASVGRSVLGNYPSSTKPISENTSGGSIPTGDVIVVVNVHLLFNLNRGDIKLAQLCDILKTSWQLCEEFGCRKVIGTPIINATIHNQPECSSLKLMAEYINSLTPTESPSCQSSLQVNTYESSSTDESILDTTSVIKGANVNQDILNNVILTYSPAIIICGDFNLCPQSSLYKWLYDSVLDFSEWPHNDSQSLSGQYLLPQQMHACGPADYDGSLGTDARLAFPAKRQFMHANWLSKLYPYIDTDFFCSSNFHFITNIDEPLQMAAVCSDDKKGTPHLCSSKFLSRRSVSDSNMKSCDYTNKTTGGKFSSTLSDLKDVEVKSPTSDRNFLTRQEALLTTFRTPFSMSSAYLTESMSHTSDEVRSDRSRSYSIKKPRNRQFSYSIGKEPAFTAHHSWQKGCIDYMWYGVNELQVVQRLKMPPFCTVHTAGSIPNDYWPLSDHFSLVADFVRKKPSDILFPCRSWIQAEDKEGDKLEHT